MSKPHTHTPGIYHERLASGVWLIVYRIRGKWFYRKMFSQYSWGAMKDMHTNRPPWMTGYETQAMAISAAKGNRAS